LNCIGREKTTLSGHPKRLDPLRQLGAVSPHANRFRL
jgi:hypothetical protein